MRAPQALFFTRIPEENDAAFRAHAFSRAFRIRLRHREHARRTRPVVIGAVIDIVAVGLRSGQTGVVEMSADHDVLVFENRVAALDNAYDVLAMRLFAPRDQFEADLLRRGERERVEFGAGTGAVKDL